MCVRNNYSLLMLCAGKLVKVRLSRGFTPIPSSVKAIVFFTCRDEQQRTKYIAKVSSCEEFPDFPGTPELIDEYWIATSELTHALACFLRQEFPFTAPISLKGKDATIGTGDRLGLANPAHIRAVRDYDIFPVLAQQSIRELNFTKRTYDDVLDAATFAVFQEGYEEGYGFDGDHLKKIDEITMALNCGATMITLDLSEVMNAKSGQLVNRKLAARYIKRINNPPAAEITCRSDSFEQIVYTQDGTTFEF